MGRPVSGYYTKDGRRLPSVTEVLGHFKDPEPLIGWAWKNGRDAGWNQAKGLPAPRSAFAEKAEAAQSGSIAHDMMEAHVKGEPYVYDGPKLVPGVMDRALQSFANGKRWLSQSALRVVSTEESLVSEKHGFGGTYDCLLQDPAGHYHMGDYKTSKAIYADYLVQVAAYEILLEECRGIKILQHHILRFSKPTADWEHKCFTGLDDGKEAFLLMLKCLPLMERLEARVK